MKILHLNKLTLAILTSLTLTACGDSSDTNSTQQTQNSTQNGSTNSAQNQTGNTFNPLLVNTLKDIEDNTEAQNSLREAITYASKNGGTITFKDGLKGDLFVLKTIAIAKAKPFSIKGPAKKDITIDGLNKVRLFTIEDSNVSMENLIIKDGESRAATNVGAGIYLKNTTLNLKNTDFIGNTYQSFIGGGGALAALGDSTVNITGGEFKENNSSGIAGAIFTDNNTKLNIDGTKFTNNSCSNADATEFCSGAAIAIKGIDTNIKNATFSKNNGVKGAGIYATLKSGKLSVDNTVFDGNGRSGEGRGSGIHAYNTDFTLTVNNSTFINNKASSGAAIAGSLVKGISINNSTFENNVVKGVTSEGGALVLNKLVKIDKSTFKGNTALEGVAGAISLEGATLTLTNSTFDGNSAIRSGAVALVNGEYTIKKSSFTNNKATKSGGALGIQNIDLLNMTESTISNNKANLGGGINTLGSTSVSVTNSTITGNSVSGQSARGGGINTLNDIVLTGTTVSGNSAKDDNNSPDTGGGVCGIGSSVKDKLTGGNITGNTPNNICGAD